MPPLLGVGMLDAVLLPPLIAGAKGVAAGRGCVFVWTFDRFQGGADTPDWGWVPCKGIVGIVGADTGRKETVGTVCAGAYCKGVLVGASGGGTLLDVSPAPTLGAWVPK